MPPPDRGPALHVHQYACGDSWVVAAAGDLDAQTLPPLQRALEAAAMTRQIVVFDASAVPFADSSTLNLLLQTHRTTRLRIAGAQPQLLRILEMTGTDATLALYPTVTEACAAVVS
ncbi:anti-anti-sigma factor [Streptomyces sp. CB01201]|nr:anti-anti-sigma factor [Streptomyces sp. CB01201]